MACTVQQARLAQMGFCEREQHLGWIEMSCRVRFGRDTYSMKAWVPPAIRPAKRRAWRLGWKVRGLPHSVSYGLCCFTVFLFQQANGERENCLIMHAQAHRASRPEMPTDWPRGRPTQQTSLKIHYTAEASVTGHGGTGSIFDKECLSSHLLSRAA